MLDNQLISFTKMHDEFIADWKEAMNSGDTSLLERMTEDYYVAFFNGAKDKPTIFNQNDAVTGMQQSVKQLLGAKKNSKIGLFA
jgi:hypothetical protein